MPRKVQQIPDYFTPEEAAALVQAAPSYPTRMAFRVMLKTGLRVSEALALRRVDLRLEQDPPIIVVRADSPGNKARKGREVPVPADLVESLRDLASFHTKDRYQPMLNLSRQRIGQVMKDVAQQVGIDPARAHPHAFRHTYGRNCVLRRSDSRAAEMAGPPVPQGHAALCGAGRRASRMGGQVVSHICWLVHRSWRIRHPRVCCAEDIEYFRGQGGRHSLPQSHRKLERKVAFARATLVNIRG